MLFSGAAVGIGFLWISAPNIPKDGKISISSNNNENGNRYSSHKEDSGNGSRPNITEDHREDNYSFVVNLLQIFGRRPSFGSYRLKGTAVYENDGKSSSAIIEDLDKNTSRIYLINEMLPDKSQLVDIKQTHIIYIAKKPSQKKNRNLLQEDG